MVRDSNGSQEQRFGPRRPPSGSGNFANLFRDPSLVLNELIAEELVRRGFGDLRPALLAVGQHIDDEGTRITELAARTLLTKATVVHTVDELEKLGYARRVPDPADGRAKLVVPTERAAGVLVAAREAIEEIRAAWAEMLGEEELDRLERSLRLLHATLWPDGPVASGP